MTSDEFLTAALGHPACPDNFESLYSEFLVYQKAAHSTLVEFHRVCEANGIPYQLAYGSLIGAVRNNGIIPWDYDVDVFVPFDDKDALISALNKDLSDQYYFYCPETDSSCRHYIMRMAPMGYRTEAVHLDVFYLMGVPQSAPKRRAHQGRVARLSEERYGKLVDAHLESLGDSRRLLSIMIRHKLPNALVNIDKNLVEFERLCRLYPFYESYICSPADVHATWYDYPTELMRDTELIDTELGQLRIPKEYDKVLKYLYGDYMSEPDLGDCIKEVVKSRNRISRIQAQKNESSL